jgi:hypothetical protein
LASPDDGTSGSAIEIKGSSECKGRKSAVAYPDEASWAEFSYNAAMYLVFSQAPGRLPDVLKLAAQASKFFDCQLELVARSGSRLQLKLVSSHPQFVQELTIDAREVTREDLANARDAEARGRAAGMGALAERCKVAWEVRGTTSAEPDPAALLTLCAICASIALGPVLPPDHSTLFGVRGAIERRDARTGSTSAPK